MKKILLFASALAGLFLAGSCQKETLEPAAHCGVTYEITLPDGPQTKGENGYDVYDLHYEVYKTADPNALATTPLLFEKTVEMTGNKTTLTLDLLNDQDYTVLFWANKKGENYFDLTDLRQVGVRQAASNNDDRDAFCGKDQLVQHDGAQSKTVELKRPFAQINIATLVPTADKIGYDVTPLSSRVKVKNIPVKYNVFTGEPVGDAVEVDYTVNLIPEGNLTVNTTEYKKVAMNYALVPATQDNSATVEVYYEINTVNGTVKNSIPNVPVKKNYRTNIIGNLLTSNATYNIELLPGFEGDNGAHVEVINEGVTKNINGDYEITNVKGLAYAINNLFVYANGVANTATFYVKPGIYDMAQQAIKDITVTSGTLKVYDSEPVVTRSVEIGGVVIEGLTKALINTVEEGATVFFSGITVTDFNGADDAAALVHNNEGKVVLVDCQILDENGAPDQNTELVGGKNDPVEVEKDEEEAGELVYTAEQLAAAFADETVESIALGADITLENTLVFPEGRTATLDLRGWELTVNEPASKYAINNHGTLTIKDSYATGEVNARGIYNGYVDGGAITDAELTIISGTFNAMGTNGGAAVYNYGKVVINGGKFQSNGGYGLNSQTGAVMTVNSADVRGGIYNCGTLTVTESKVYQHLSGKHCIYNWKGSVTIESGEFDSESGNELIFADGQNASVVIEDGEFHKTAKSWLYAAATGKDITFTITGGTHYGYVNEPEMTVDTFRPYGDPIVVTGGSYNFDVTNWCAKDYKAVKNAETAMWDVVKKEYVAKIGEDGYESLQEAFNAGGEIYLVSDVKLTEMAVLESGKTAVLDLNGYAITVPEAEKHIYALNNKGTLTIKDSEGTGRISARGIYNGYNGNSDETVAGAKLTVENGNFYALDSDGGACILNCAEAIINGGTFDGQVAAVNGRKCGKTTINGGTFKSVSHYVIQQNGGGELTINNATVDRGFGAVGCFGGKVTIIDGTYMPTGKTANTCHVVYVDAAADVIINGGTYKMNYPENALPDSGSAVASYYGGKLSISGGTFYSHFDNVSPVELSSGSTITGGTFYNHSGEASSHSYITNFIADGYVLKNGTVEKFVPAAKVGNTEYGSIDEAVAAWVAQNNATLTLCEDVTLSDVVTLKSTEHHILNLATYKMTAASGKNAIEIVPEGDGAGTAAKSCLTINADATNPGSMNAGSKACVYYKKTNGINDRIMVTFNGGIFNGTISSSSNNGGQACPYFVFNGGVFNKSINLTKAMLKVTGGIFHGMFSCTGDSTAYRLISGGTFKSWTYMTADAANKFSVGTDKQVYNVGVYVNKDGYLVVGGPVIKEAPGENYEKKSYSSWNTWLQYSSAAEYGLYYEK